MNNEMSYPNVNIKDENVENDLELEESLKSNAFLYVDINEYNENNLEGIDIKEEEEQVEVFSAEKNAFQSNEICFEETLPLNSLKNLVNHSQLENIIETCSKSVKKKKDFSRKSVQKENISVKSPKPSNCIENSDFSGLKNSEPNRYKLRTRTWSQKIDFSLLENDVEKKKKKKLSTLKKNSFCMECGVKFLSENNFLIHETKKKNFQCTNCSKCFCTGSLLNVHKKTCKHNKNNRNIKKFSGKKHKALINDKIFFGKSFKENKRIHFKCNKCSKNFMKKHNLVSHILKNKCCSEIYTCAICEETLFKKNILKKHITAHLKSQLSCQCCFQTFENHQDLSSHSCKKKIKESSAYSKCDFNCKIKINSYKNDCADYDCTVCNNSIGSQECADKKSSVDCSTIYKCQLCEKVFKGITHYEKHLASHKDKCNIINKDNSFSNLRTYANAGTCQGSNMKSKKKFKYECDTCGKGFLKLVRLKIHILNIHQGVNFKCGKCSVKFPNQKDLDIHINAQDCKPEDLCTCKTCGKVFAKRDYLKKHQYMHMNVLFKCKYCYGAFMKEKSYKRHMERKNCSKSARKIRMAEFNFKKCRICEIEYETEELLIKHFKETHIDLEPHQCFCCDSCLPTFQDLQNHIHQHNIQKYTCNLCGKPYTSQEGFRKHRLKHKGAEFKCQFCDSEFLNESRFKFHEKTCKKNPESGYEPSQEKEKPKKKDDKPKQSRQLHWESRIIMKRLRGDPKQLAGSQANRESDRPESTITSTFFDEPETDTSDDRGWFSNYYKTNEDDIAFGLKKAEEATPQDSSLDLDVPDFLQTGTDIKKKKTNSSLSSDFNTLNSNPNENHEINGGLDDCCETSSEGSSTDSDEVEGEDLPIDYNPKKCRLCVISFGQEYELLHHFIKAHPGEYAHKCPQCEVQSPLYAQLKEHLKAHGIGIGIFNCDNCSKQFKSEKKMNAHNILCKGINNKESARDRKFISNVNNESCKRCGKKFHTKFGYRRHKQLCKKQKSKSKNSGKLVCHPVKSVTKEEAVFNNSPACNDLRLTDSEKDEEEEVSKAKYKLLHESANSEHFSPTKSSDVSVKDGVEEKKKEVGVFTGEPPMDSFPCRLCDKKFQYERGIVMHFKTAHPGHKPLICHVCNMHLADKLKEHLKTHGIGEEFVCELCGKRFNQKFLSKIHEMWHQGIEYKCNNCKQKFLNKEKMDKHITENRCSNRQSLMRLPCDICGKSYRSKFGLSKHYITHTPKELRPVKNRMNCEYCGKWFEYNNGLQRHRRIHTGERPFCCRFCPKAFAQEGNCKAHERIHTGESKPRKKKSSSAPGNVSVSSETPQSTVLNPQLSSVPSHFPSAVSTVESVPYPGHINLFIYNNVDSSGIVN